jgi:hypothetical protein
VKTKVEKVAWLAEIQGVDPSEFEHLSIAELSKMVKDQQQLIKDHEEAEAISPIIRPGEQIGPSIRDSATEVGKVKLGKDAEGKDIFCSVDQIVAYKGKDINKISGAHQTTVINPKNGRPGMVTFEKRPNVWEQNPIAIVRDWRIMAQVLFKAQVVITNPTLGHQNVRVLSRDDYFLPLDLKPNRQAVERMANYVRGSLMEVDETERLTQSIAANLIQPEV